MTYRASRMVPSVAVAAATMLALAPGAIADPPPAGAYQEDDGLGFRNIVPPGSDGVVSTTEAFEFLADGSRPPHNNDQLDEYDELVQSVPGITEGEVDTFFKDASFGVPPADAGETYTPQCTTTTAPSANSASCDDVTIVRDESFGVPHIYGADRAGAMFGAGYVAAEDRLFFMDFERHLGRAELSTFIGGSNIGTDRALWRDAPYTEAELQAQYDDLDDFRGAEGAQVKKDVQNYADGINQYIAEARVGDPDSPIPGEYVLALGDTDGPDEWEVTDIGATASLVAGQFGKGGGGEVGSALVLEEAVERFEGDGRDVWEDFRSREDGEAPTTVHNGDTFPYGAPPATPDDVALPDPGTTVPEPLSEPGSAKVKAQGPKPGKALLDIESASNALLVSDAESAGDHPLAVMGPQVGYFSPQILQELDIHAPTTVGEGPGVDARGVGFAGISMYVLLGRGQDYSWSATSAGQDITDTYAVELCDPANPGDPGAMDDTGYRYDGACLPFEVLEKTNSWEPTTADPTPAGSETLVALRSKLGIVTHRAMVGGVPHAYTKLRATYMHEADSAVGFARFNQPSTMDSVAEFEDAANTIDYTFNWFYTDEEEISYFNSGANPVRPADVDPNLPVTGAPENTWSNFDPDDVTFDRGAAAAHAQVTDQDWISSWNNKQAPGFSAADDTYSYGSVHRSDSLDERLAAGTEGPETMTRAELVDAAEDAATVDLRGTQVLPIVVKALNEASKNKSKAAKNALGELKDWSRDGAHRIDRNENGTYDDTKAVRHMDAWWPHLVKAQFKPELGGPLYNQIQTMIGLDDAPGSGGSAYISGWYGYVDKDLRSVLGKPVTDPYSREYCGGGQKKECGNDLLKSLETALKNKSNNDLYPGHPTAACQALPTSPSAQWCFDSIRHTTVGVIPQPPIDWQNRPTFQQVVEAQNNIP